MAKRFPRRTTQGTKRSGFKQGTTGRGHGKRSAGFDRNRFGR